MKKMRCRERAEGRAELLFRLKLWIATLSPELAAEAGRTVNELALELEIDLMRRYEWTPSKAEEDAHKIELEVLLKAARDSCAGCRERKNPHRCRAIPIRKMMWRIDPVHCGVSPKDWMPSPPGSRP